VAVVTGAGSGIGRALAIGLAAEGAKVVLADIEAGPLEETSELVRGAGADALAVVTDVSDASSVQALADTTIERFGQVNVLCNNAGVGGGGLIRDQQLVDWQWVIGVNLWGVIHGIQAFLPLLRQADEAHIMSTASVAGLVAGPGLGPYNATKFAVVGIMETLHHELAADRDADVGVSVLCPGEVRTNIVTAQRNRPAHLQREQAHGRDSDARRRNASVAAAVAAGMDPAEVAAQVIGAIKERRFWVLSHPGYLDLVRRRNDQLHALANPTLTTAFTVDRARDQLGEQAGD
jgi:NAD(P)-dependent dehydrogenase (short-subunit alcohol dehydrogenase family)